MDDRAQPRRRVEELTFTEADLRGWWEAEVDMVLEVGGQLEPVADAMFIVAAGRLAEAMGPRRMARVTYLLALKLSAGADAIDAATETVFAGRC